MIQQQVIRSKLRQKLCTRQKVFGGWTSLAHPSITEIFARMGVDFIGIDIEHSTINQGESQRIIAAAQAAGVCCLPRVASHNKEMIKRLLDSGADGIIVPMVSKPSEVEALIEWCKYPPKGRRSYGIARGHGYGFDFEEYTNSWNKSSSLIIQIESIEGVENIDKLLSYEEIDGAMLGPYDLSGSLGVPGQLEHLLVMEASQRVIESCKKCAKGLGTQVIEPTEDALNKVFDAGYTFAVLSSDVFLLWKWADRMKNLVRLFIPRKDF